MLSQTAEVRRKQRISNGAGGWTTGFPDEPTATVQCRIRSWTSEEQLVARQEGVRISHVMYVEADTDVQRGDEVRWTVDLTTGTLVVTAEVRSTRRPSVPGHHLMVDLEERQS